MDATRENLALDLLRADLAESGDGVSAHAIEVGAMTRHPGTLIRGLRRRGCVIEERDGWFRLYAESSVSTELPGARPFVPPHGVAGRPGGSVDAELRLFELEAA